MIYQFAPTAKLAVPPIGPVYRCLNLDEPQIADCLPEAQNEWQGIVYCQKHPELDADPWIGFTSYRQRQKSQVVFHDAACIVEALQRRQVLAFYWRDVQNLAGQAERCMPGFDAAVQKMLGAFKEAIPLQWHQHRFGAFADFWIMAKPEFHAFMAWAVPRLRWLLNDPAHKAWLALDKGHMNHFGQLAERMVILWYYLAKKQVQPVTRSPTSP
jgi:hypothetical protein